MRQPASAPRAPARSPGRWLVCRPKGWRVTAFTVDRKLQPEPPGAFEAIAAAKDALAIAIEISAPDSFISELPSREGRRPYVATFGAADFRHYDF